MAPSVRERGERYRIAAPGDPRGQAASTRYRVLAVLDALDPTIPSGGLSHEECAPGVGPAGQHQYSLLEVVPETGRSHQNPATSGAYRRAGPRRWPLWARGAGAAAGAARLPVEHPAPRDGRGADVRRPAPAPVRRAACAMPFWGEARFAVAHARGAGHRCACPARGPGMRRRAPATPRPREGRRRVDGPFRRGRRDPGLAAVGNLPAGTAGGRSCHHDLPPGQRGRRRTAGAGGGPLRPGTGGKRVCRSPAWRGAALARRTRRRATAGQPGRSLRPGAGQRAYGPGPGAASKSPGRVGRAHEPRVRGASGRRSALPQIQAPAGQPGARSPVAGAGAVRACRRAGVGRIPGPRGWPDVPGAAGRRLERRAVP